MEGIKNICGLKKVMSKIFVCAPTMNDFEYLSTVERAYDYSSSPDNLSIATTIFWKSKDIRENTRPFFSYIKNGLDKNFKNVKYDIQPWILYPGVGAGRLAPIKYFNNEKYFLSIDSHTDFIQDWDLKLIELYENSRKYFGKLRVLTTYLSPYENNYENFNNENDYKKTIQKCGDLVNRWPFFDFYKSSLDLESNEIVFPFPNDRFLNQYDLDNFSKYFINDEYLPAKKISAHCYFTESDPWVTKYNLNMNKNINFWAEEFYQSALAYARGYNLVWNKTQILFHQYKGFPISREYEHQYSENFDSTEEKIILYKNYIKNMVQDKENISSFKTDKTIILELLSGKNNNLGYLPRSINGFLNYEGIDIFNKKTSPWWKVPDLNVIYK